MDFGFTREQQLLVEAVRQFCKEKVTGELVKELEKEFIWSILPDSGFSPVVTEFSRELGAKGWLEITWPKQYGGLERDVMDQYLVLEELARYRVTIPNREAVFMIGPTILLYGSDEQKSEYLPRIARGEIEFALGYTEPEAGTDLASLQMQAIEDGDDYVITGQKVFNTACHYAEYHWLAARTDFDAPKHRGISIFIVDMKSPGITVNPMYTMAGDRTNEVFYDGVRVPKGNMVGEKNKGWGYIIAALDVERLSLVPVAELRVFFDELVSYVRENWSEPSLDKRILVRHRLSELAIELEVGRLLTFHALWMMQKGGIPPHAETAGIKCFMPEVAVRVAELGMQILGLSGQLQMGSKEAPLGGKIELANRAAVYLCFAAGGSGVMRDLIARLRLGLPRG